MTEQPNDLSAIFLAAIELSASDRQDFLDQKCADDPELKKQLDILLAAHSKAGDFLSHPPAALDATQARQIQPSADGVGSLPVSSNQHSILDEIGKTIDTEVPRVVLDSSPDEPSAPIVRPTSKQIPKGDGDRYQIQGEIARGGMGAILKGRDPELGRDLAIKVLLDEHRDKPAVIQRFVEEAQIGGQLQHPGIVPVYDLDVFKDQRPFFTMKLVKGKTLAALLSERKSLTEDRTRFLGIFEQVCQTMAYAHSRSVIHRDLKPSNVMVGAFGEVQVMDWGLAKVLSEGGVADEKRANDNRTNLSIIQTIRSLGSDTPAGWESSAGSHTQMGSVMGTPAYMAPEQALGEIDRLDQRSDVFGLGAILCEILTGHPPYTGEDHIDVFRKASRAKLNECFERLESVGSNGPEVDGDLVQLVRNCLEAEPDDRVRDAGELSERVTSYLESVEQRLRRAELARVEVATKAEEERKRRKIFMALAGTIMVTFGLVGSGWLYIQQQQAAIQQAAEQRRVEAEQEARDEISRAEALAQLEIKQLPNLDEVSRALAALERAETSLEKGTPDSSLVSTAKTLRTRLEALQSEQELAKALEKAWQTERAQTDEINGGLREGTEEVLDAEREYRKAFANWGLVLGETEETVEKIKALHESTRPTALVSLDRWLALIKAGPTVQQLEQQDWKSLKPTAITSRGGDTLTVLEDQSILASGAHGYTGYELEFETDQKIITAFRLEALPHDLLPKKGPGRGSEGNFRIRNQRITVAPKSDPSNKRVVEFSSAKASYAGELWDVTPESWHVATKHVGKRQVAVYSCKEPLESDSGFVVRITNGDHPRRSDGKSILALGRFRWAVNSKKSDKRDTARLARLVDQVDQDPWRKGLQSEIARGDIPAIFDRISDHSTTNAQPRMVLIQLADYLQSIPESEIHKLIPQMVTWDPLAPQDLKIELEPGVNYAERGDGSIVLSGNYPERETISITVDIEPNKPVRAIRLELLTAPDKQDSRPNIGRRGATNRLAEIDAWLQTNSGNEVRIPFRHVFSDYAGQISWGNVTDGDDQTFAFLKDPFQPRTITLVLDQATINSAMENEEIAIKLQTKTLRYGCLARLRVSITRDEIDVPNPSSTALSLLQRLNQQDPRDYWVQMALARTMRNQIPPRMEEALHHATAAVAVRPKVVSSHETLLRSLRTDQLNPGSATAQLALRHAAEIRKLGGSSLAARDLASASYNDAVRLADERQNSRAAEKFRLSLQLDPDAPQRIHNVGSQLKTLKKYEEAIEIYENGIQHHPDSGMLHNGLGLAHLAMLDTEKTDAAYRKAIEVQPTFLDAYYNLSKSLRDQGKSNEAIDLLQQAIDVDPDNPDSLNRMGVLYDNLGNREQAIEFYRRTIDVDAAYGIAQRNLAVKLKDQDKWDEAIEVLKEAIKSQPHDSHNHFYLGWTYHSASSDTTNKYWDEAIDSYRRAVELRPTNSQYRNYLANLLTSLQRDEEAIGVWEECIPLLPNKTFPLNNLGVAYNRIGRVEEATEAYRRVLELDPKASYISFGNLATCLRTLGRYEEAEQVYRDSIRANPTEPQAYRYLANYLRHRKRYDEAAENYRRSIELNTRDDGTYHSFADMWFDQGKLDDAIALRKEQLVKYPQLWDAWRILGDRLYAKNRYEEVIPLFLKALENQPNNANLQHSIAWSLVKHPGNDKQAEWALELAKKAAAAKPNESLALDVLGVAHFRAGNFKEAEETLDRAATRHEIERGEFSALYPVLARRAIRHCVLSQIAHKRKKPEKALKFLRYAEQETAPWSMADVIDPITLWNQLAMAAYSFLTETRELLDAPSPETLEQRVELGIQRLEEYTQRYPDDAWAVERLSALYAWFGRKEKHEKLSVRALDLLKADDTAGRYHQRALGVLMMSNADKEVMQRAIEAARTAMTKPGAGVWERLTHGLAEARAGNFELAEKRFDAVYGWGDSIIPGPNADRFTEALLRRSVARHHLGKTSEARMDFERARSRIDLPLPLKTELTQDTERVTRLRVWLAYEEAAMIFEPSTEE